jgi:enoyl-[acyl-carrier protein] reductase I
MSILANKRALITGVANEWSIAWAIANAFHRADAALAFTCLNSNLRRVRRLAESVGSDIVIPCDVRDDAQLDSLFEQLGRRWDSLDILLHSIAFAHTEDLQRDFIETSREGWETALDASVYSLIAISRRALSLMKGRGGSVVTLTFHGGEKVVPGYNVMGVAKAALNMAVRYLANDVGPHGVRVNAISAGPMKTLSSSVVNDIDRALEMARLHSPLRSAACQSDVGDTAVFLASDLAQRITGEIIHVDSGLSILAVINSDAARRI